MNLFKPKLKHRRRRLAIFGATPRADWRAILVIGIVAIACGVLYAEVRLDAVRDAAAAGELRRGGEDTLVAPGAIELVSSFAERGPSPIAPAAATGTPAASATTSPATTTVAGE